MKTKQNTSKGQKNQKTDDFYEVEHIISKKLEDGVAKYLVKWHGYNEEDNTWEPLENLTGVMDLVEDFEEKLKFSKDGRKVKPSIQAKKPQLKKVTVIESEDEIEKVQKLIIARKRTNKTLENHPKSLKAITTNSNLRNFSKEIPNSNLRNSSKEILKKKTGIKTKRSEMESLIHDKPQIVVSKEKEVKPLLRKKIKLDNLNKMKIVNLDENEISPCIRKPKEEKIEIKKAGVGKELKNSSRRGRKNIPELENKTEPKKKPIEIKKSFISEVDLEKELKKFSLNPIEKKKGSFDFGDLAEEIIKAHPSESGSLEIICLVRWKERSDGTVPLLSNVSNNIIKIKDPQLLIRFYESKLLFSPNITQNAQSTESKPIEEQHQTPKKLPQEPQLSPNKTIENLIEDKQKNKAKTFKKQDFKKHENSEEKHIQEKENEIVEESLSDFMHLHQNEEEIRKNEEHKKNEERKKEEEERKKEEIMLKFANEVMLGLEKRAENEEIKQKNNVFVEFDLN